MSSRVLLRRNVAVFGLRAGSAVSGERMAAARNAAWFSPSCSSTAVEAEGSRRLFCLHQCSRQAGSADARLNLRISSTTDFSLLASGPQGLFWKPETRNHPLP